MELTAPGAVDGSEPTDAELVATLAAGDLRALGALYARHKGMVRAAVRRFAPLSPPADVEELVEEVFLALPGAAARYEERTRFKAWLFGIAIRKTRSFRRKAWLRRVAVRPSGEPRDPGPAPDRRIEQRDLALKLLAALPDGQREVLVLHAVEGLDGAEIAELLGVSAATVWTRLHRARRAVLAMQEAAVPAGRAALEVER
jgi:RNA polymerase sigma-70 factor (ECF subfamily)